MIGNLDDTIYSGKENVVNGWNKFYLQDKVSMQVVGKVEGTSCPCGQLVLMTCEDKKVYAYDGEELHLVASSLKQLIEEGIEYPSDKTYYKGEALKHMTDEDWEKVRKGPVGKRLDEEHRKLVKARESKFLENLKFIRQCRERKMANLPGGCKSAGQQLDMPTNELIKKLQVSDPVIKVAELLSTIRHKTIDLKKPAGAKWMIGNLDDTIYSGKENVVNGWNKFYLPDKVSMQVVGKVEGTSCPCGQLVLMTCEEKRCMPTMERSCIWWLQA
ncbi:uncharacterized protein LOC129115552 [Anoplopoma fimbria]|uniref:uncharacterized protein LOC129115552 n=1 Tax=Anoplopoma fimbria TaxID=229290 RepID=UPI0023ED7540|nr:uncharacterized protein LOC129115552 [Anoplopoma fimbria]